MDRNDYQVIVEQAPIMIWRANTSSECDYFNERWLAFTGRSLEQEVGNGWVEGVFQRDLEMCMKVYTSHFRLHETFEMRYRLRRYDGQYRWIFDRGVPFFLGDHEFGGYIGSCIDVTEQVMADDYLNRQRQKELDDLRGLLPICAYCKSIRDDSGEWHSLESYIHDHSKTDFTHGICPDCREKYFPDEK
jgi:PAS domain S-box-containing protein